VFREMQDDEKETPKQGDNAPSISKATLIKALDEYIMGVPSGEVREKYGIPAATFTRFRQRAGVPASGRVVRTDKVKEWRKAYDRLGSVEAVKQECGGDKSTIIRELGIEAPPDPEPVRQDGKNLLSMPISWTPFQRFRVKQLRSEVMSEVPWVFPGCEEAIQGLQAHDDGWWWRRLNWTIAEWAEEAGVI